MSSARIIRRELIEKAGATLPVFGASLASGSQSASRGTGATFGISTLGFPDHTNAQLAEDLAGSQSPAVTIRDSSRRSARSNAPIPTVARIATPIRHTAALSCPAQVIGCRGKLQKMLAESSQTCMLRH